MIGGTATFIEAGLRHQRYLDSGITKSGFGSSASRVYGNMLVNGLKLAGVDSTLTGAYDVGTKFYDGAQGYKAFQNAKNVRNTADEASDASKVLQQTKESTKANKALSVMKKVPAPPAGVEKALSKFNVAAAAIGTVASGAKTIGEIRNASDVLNSNASGADKTAAVADATASAGNTLMNAGVVTSAVPVPGARVAGGIMVAGGAVLWGASKATKYVAENWNSIKETGKKVWEGTKNIAKKGWDAVTGLFG
ncbi:hypothetical protein [Virgibacillus ihumii]|uniref:hypothetical protein n=1 Tax=Virgibacillus ihumii TaxID=2686091 RepID=UPI00157D8A67|nr:hypothetical protein [Virgibacillus ihumii]